MSKSDKKYIIQEKRKKKKKKKFACCLMYYFNKMTFYSWDTADGEITQSNIFPLPNFIK